MGNTGAGAVGLPQHRIGPGNLLPEEPCGYDGSPPEGADASKLREPQVALASVDHGGCPGQKICLQVGGLGAQGHHRVAVEGLGEVQHRLGLLGGDAAREHDGLQRLPLGQPSQVSGLAQVPSDEGTLGLGLGVHESTANGAGRMPST